MEYLPEKRSFINKIVNYRKDLAEKYEGKWVSCFEKKDHINLKDDLEIVYKNQNYIFKYNNKPVGAIIRDVAQKEVSEHFAAKMRLTIDSHPDLNRGESCADFGKLVGHGNRKNPLNPFSGTYVYQEKDLSIEAIKFYDDCGNTFANWLYDNAEKFLPWTMVSYKEFQNRVKLENDELIGALFCAKNYEAVGHKDKDRSEWAVGYVYEDGIVKDGYFFYPEYGIAIEMSSNSMWCWLTKAVHGTARLNKSEGGTRYTAAITLTEKTARAIEKEKGLR